MRDLRQRGLQALAVAVRADPQLQAAVGCEAGLALLVAGHERDAPGGIDAGAVPGLLGVHGKADADAAPVGLAALLALAHLVEADGLDRLPQGLGIVAGIEVALGDVVERHLLGTHQALEPKLVGLDPELARQRVERDFQGEAHARARHAAIGQDRRLVGGNRPGAAAIVREIVEARQDGADLPRLQAGRERIGRVGAGIDGGLAIERQQLAVGVGVGGENVVMLAAIGAGDQVLAPVLEPPQREAELARGPRQRDFLGQQDALVAEAAADIGRHHADLAFVQAQAFGEAGADDVRLLRGAGDDQLVEPACSSLQPRRGLRADTSPAVPCAARGSRRPLPWL